MWDLVVAIFILCFCTSIIFLIGNVMIALIIQLVYYRKNKTNNKK